ncbi:MAG: hypothetical protein UT63_C0070G0006 [Candidatus Gottesmanbacteria bacterium GW2011_GWC2_39_8]|nr:MAG: hypothetical protein UT63_C0070G0006 [Candidatus Gottesmanbacteria bacterium GW2011_GWC2_39_8]
MVPANPTFDSLASALALYLALNNGDRNAVVVSQNPATVEISHLVGADKIQNNLGGSDKNLVVSFPYQEGSIEKVSYNIENETFNLIIEPREGYPSLSPDNVNYSYGGGGLFDTIITLGVPTFNDLGSLYTGNEGFYNDKPIINIDYHFNNNKYANVNIVDANATSVSEMTVQFVKDMALPLDIDIATNLLAGITEMTNNFTNVRGGKTFEMVAHLYNAGAKRLEPTGNRPPAYSFNTPNNAPPQNPPPAPAAYNPPPVQNYNQPPASPQPMSQPAYNPPPVTNQQQNYNQPQYNQPVNNSPQGYNPPAYNPPQNNQSYNQPNYPKSPAAPKPAYKPQPNYGQQQQYQPNQPKPQPQPNYQQPGQPSPQPKPQYQQPQQPKQNPPQQGQPQPGQNQQPGNQQKKDQKDTPPDWLKPKIYKGSTLL